MKITLSDSGLNLAELMKAASIDESQAEACRAYLNATSALDLSDFEESYQGQFKNDEDFAQDMAKQTGEVDFKNMAWPVYCIDWEYAARELMMDYSEENGHYFRNL